MQKSEAQMQCTGELTTILRNKRLEKRRREPDEECGWQKRERRSNQGSVEGKVQCRGEGEYEEESTAWLIYEGYVRRMEPEIGSVQKVLGIMVELVWNGE